MLHNLNEKDFEDILSYADTLKSNASKLKKVDPDDSYWQSLSHETELVRNGLFLESNMVTSWYANKFKPKRILEIGTRTGGSLVALLSVYSKQEYADIEEIVSFDMWREYVSTTRFSSAITKITGSKSKFNFAKSIDLFGRLIEKKSIGKVKRNLAVLNLPSDKIHFVSGDSKIKVPEYFAKNQQKQFDYILVDGGHDDHTALCDLMNVADYVAPNGVILFDDIMPESYNLIGVWNQFKENQKDKFDYFEIFHRKGIAFAIKK